MGRDHEQPSRPEAPKKVDESWKTSVDKEKDLNSDTGEAGDPQPPEPNFHFFVSTLGMQTLVALGEIPNPATHEKKTDVGQARYLIDLIQMLSDKTKGNLSKDEEAMIQDLLYQLRMKFVEKTQNS